VSTEDQAGRADQAAPMTPRGAARRRLAKAGLGAAGVLWTAQSHAGMAPLVCTSPSAALSTGLQSNYGNKPKNCAGKSPGYWKNHGGWPVPSDTQFNAVFNCSFKNDSTYGSSTLLEIVSGRDFDKYNLGMHLVVTYLNVRSGRIGFLSERTLLQMWSELQSAGVYQPAKGVFWSAEQTKRYLESTHD
jgi:hypothetical protein